MARHMRNGRDYSRPGPKVDYELRKDSNNAARSGEVYDKFEEINTRLTKEPYIVVDTKPVQAGAYQLIASYVIQEDGVYDIISYMNISVSSNSMYNNAIFINPDDSVTTYKEETVIRSTMLGGGGSIAYMTTSLKKGDNVKVFAYTSVTCNAKARLTVAKRF